MQDDTNTTDAGVVADVVATEEETTVEAEVAPAEGAVEETEAAA